MKIAVVFVPRASQVTMFVNNTHKPPCAFVLGRGLELGILTVLLLCSLTLIAWSYKPTLRFEFAAAALTPQVPVNPYVCAVPARLIAHPIENPRSLKVGDLVIVAGHPTSALREIAATPRDTLALWDGQALKNFYAVGDDGFVVVADNQYSIVHADEIRAAFPSSRILNAEDDAHEFALGALNHRL